MVYFISGHLDLTFEEFWEHYVPQIEKALMRGQADFVVGDARGADTLSQTHLSRVRTNTHPFSMTVYHMFDSPRNNEGNFPTVGGFSSDQERDEAMTAASDEDIAWVRPGREKSGTANNLKRRLGRENT